MALLNALFIHCSLFFLLPRVVSGGGAGGEDLTWPVVPPLITARSTGVFAHPPPPSSLCHPTYSARSGLYVSQGPAVLYFQLYAPLLPCPVPDACSTTVGHRPSSGCALAESHTRCALCFLWCALGYLVPSRYVGTRASSSGPRGVRGASHDTCHSPS